MSDPPEWSASLIFTIGFFVEIGLVAIAALIGMLAFEAPFPFVLKFEVTSALIGLAATAPAVIAAALLTSPLGRRIPPFERIYRKVKEILDRPLRDFSVVDILLLAGAAGIGEEILFRGVLQQLAGIYLAGVIFGLLHALTISYFILATLMGLYLGWLFDATGNLLAPIMVHWLYDAAALYFLRMRFLKDQAEAASEDQGLEPPLQPPVDGPGTAG